MRNIELLNKDCLLAMKEMNDDTVDLTITSPPYDNLRTYVNGKYENNDYEKIINELYRVTKNGGVVVWNVADQVKNGSETGSSFRQALMFMDLGFRLHDTMIWQKDTSAFPEHVRYNQIFEYMFIFSKGKPKSFNPIKDKKNKWAGNKIHGTIRNANGTTSKRNGKWIKTSVSEFGMRNNVWNIPTEKNNKTGHPAVFPLQLANDHVISWSNENDIVFDPFMGSGTTGIGALKNNRNFIGVELEKKYFDVAKNRIEQVENLELLDD